MTTVDHDFWMVKALDQAQQALVHDEVPVGAVVVQEAKIIGAGFNKPITSHDSSAHAEIVALRSASQNKLNYRLPGATLYVTIEPCTMCVGAMIHARIDTVVFGAREPRAGALVSNLQLHESGIYNHQLNMVEGVRADECSLLISEFFRHKRQG